LRGCLIVTTDEKVYLQSYALGVPFLQGLPAFRGDVAIGAVAKVTLLERLSHEVRDLKVDQLDVQLWCNKTRRQSYVP